jgi:MFS family permease
MSRPGEAGVAGRYRTLLTSREYVGLLASRVLSLVGDQLARVALTVLVFQRTGSPLLSALTYAVTFLPVILGGPLLGGLADRLPRRRLLIAADLLRAVLFAIMALPGMPLWALLTLVLLATTVEAPWAAARAPLMRDILVDDDGYQRGTGLDETIEQSGQIVGFAAAGALLVVFSPSTALLLDAATFAVSALIVRLLVRERTAADIAPRRTHGRALTRRVRLGLSDARIGLRAAVAPRCRRPLLLTWAGISCSIAPEALATPWAKSLGAGSIGIGLLFAAGPLGNVLGLIAVGHLPARRAQRYMLPLALLTVVPLVLCFGDPDLPTAFVLVALSGFGATYSMLARVAFVRDVAEPQRGRAFSIAAAGVTAGQGVGIAGAGLAAAVYSPAAAVGLFGVLGLVLVLAAVLVSPTAEPERMLPSADTGAPAEKPDAPLPMHPSQRATVVRSG